MLASVVVDGCVTVSKQKMPPGLLPRWHWQISSVVRVLGTLGGWHFEQIARARDNILIDRKDCPVLLLR